VVSIADAGGVVVNSSGVSVTGRTTNGSVVTINGFPSSLQSTTLGAGLGLQVQTTTTLNTYTYHKLIAKETDITQLSDDINDFNARYRVSDNAPTTDLDEGDLWYDRTANKMKVYDTSTSAWKEVQSVGNFFINTLSSSSGTGGGSATFNGSAYRFTLSNAGANAQQMLVSVNGVIQKPNSGTSQPSEGFAIENNDIIFAAAPASGASHFIVTLGSTVNIGQPSSNTVDTSELVDGAVTNAKVSSSAAIAQSKLNLSITNAEVNNSAAISGTKISPNFGTQNIVTTGLAGIGTTNPSSVFHISGTDQAYSGNVAVGAIATVSDPVGRTVQVVAPGTVGEGGIGTSSNHDFTLFTGNTEKVRLNQSGNLGIGLTSPTQARLVAQTASGMSIAAVKDNTGASMSFGGVTQPRVLLEAGASASQFKIFTAGGSAYNSASWSERLRIHPGGIVSIPVGIELGSGVDGTSANTLDDYEEGQWTADLQAATNNNGGFTFTGNTGSYIKIGKLCFISIFLLWSGSTRTGTNMQLTGLPFTAQTNNQRRGGFQVTYRNNAFINLSNVHDLTLRTETNQTVARFQFGNGNGNAHDELSGSNFNTAGGNMMITGCYETT
jgi:hypothetical protein